MAKKTGRSKTRNKNQRHLKAVPSAPKMPLQLVLNHRVVDSMAVEFIQWSAAEFRDPAEAFECLELVKVFLSAQHAIEGSSSATAIAGEGVEAAVESIAAALDPEHADDAFDDLYFALESYVRFLKGTGRWTGTEGAYAELQAVLGSGPAVAATDHPDIVVPRLSDEEQESAFDAMPLIRRASALLEWLGAGKEVTATGALRLKDIEPAAAAVEVLARGKRGAKRPATESAGERPDGPLEVGSMFDVPVLNEVWSALVGAGVIRLGSTRAVPGPEAAAWNSAEVGERLKARRMLAVVLLLGVLSSSDAVWDVESVGGTVLAVLTYGTTEDPVPVAQLEALASMELGETFPDHGIVDDPDLSDASQDEARLEAIYASYAAMEARRSLGLLAELGLVDANTHYRVPPVAIQCVDLAAGYLDTADELSGAEEPESNVVALHAPSRTGRPSKDR
ncbi:hypothetical protein [Pseudarthrobacter sulfonivorans]|uniref:hypothetical protein n=1 Tax=Pseudarthrobacter sulfonivorans TaxID=121292 RepID=UPI00278292B3|nr:hypothetical protein [Pseudarthrobacter sulfonivorans]MDP9997050.1 hypothetical protein [Pseudarthrobacter sulfonivorans]